MQWETKGALFLVPMSFNFSFGEKAREFSHPSFPEVSFRGKKRKGRKNMRRIAEGGKKMWMSQACPHVFKMLGKKDQYFHFIPLLQFQALYGRGDDDIKKYIRNSWSRNSDYVWNIRQVFLSQWVRSCDVKPNNFLLPFHCLQRVLFIPNAL